MKQFSPRLAAKALWQLRIRRRPYVLSHGITVQCNLRCRFCEYWANPAKEMSTPEIFRMPKPNLDLAAFNTQISIKREVGRIHKFNPQSVDPLVDANDSRAEVIRCSEPIQTEWFEVFYYSTFPVNQ